MPRRKKTFRSKIIDILQDFILIIIRIIKCFLIYIAINGGLILIRWLIENIFPSGKNIITPLLELLTLLEHGGWVVFFVIIFLTEIWDYIKDKSHRNNNKK